MTIASRLTDMHACPMFDGPKPHVGGPVVAPGAMTVLAMGLPASNVNTMASCAGPPDFLMKGSLTVTVGGMPWVRLYIDLTVHGGMVTGPGCPTILVGG